MLPEMSSPVGLVWREELCGGCLQYLISFLKQALSSSLQPPNHFINTKFHFITSNKSLLMLYTLSIVNSLFQ